MLPARHAVRAALIALSVTAIALSSIAATRGAAVQSSAAPTASRQPTNHWLDNLKAPHRQFFDAPTPNGGMPLVHVMNYYDTYNKSFGVKDANINAVLPFYGATTLYGLSDAAWAKYRLGEFLETNDAVTGKPATTNPWRTAPVALGMTLPAASIESLRARGATFILCNNALGIFANLIAAKRGLDGTAVYEDLKTMILPGVELVPGMVIAVEQAQRAGLTYMRQ
ncbi:MAG: hypothetical protein ABUL71_01550 [Gemmatimonadota bacterium]